MYSPKTREFLGQVLIGIEKIDGIRYRVKLRLHTKHTFQELMAKGVILSKFMLTGQLSWIFDSNELDLIQAQIEELKKYGARIYTDFTKSQMALFIAELI